MYTRRSFEFLGVGSKLLSCPPVKSQTRSIGDKSGSRAGHERMLTLASSRNCVVNLAVWGRVLSCREMGFTSPWRYRRTISFLAHWSCNLRPLSCLGWRVKVRFIPPQFTTLCVWTQEILHLLVMHAQKQTIGRQSTLFGDIWIKLGVQHLPSIYLQWFVLWMIRLWGTKSAFFTIWSSTLSSTSTATIMNSFFRPSRSTSLTVSTHGQRLFKLKVRPLSS